MSFWGKALTVAQEFRPDVGLLDIGLPEMNGYVLAEKLRAMPGLKGMRLVALTGYGQAEDFARARGRARRSSRQADRPGSA